jgi:integrase
LLAATGLRISEAIALRCHHIPAAKDLTNIRAWIKTWNENPRPFVWTKTADKILDSIARYCERINESRDWARRSLLAGASGARGAPAHRMRADDGL